MMDRISDAMVSPQLTGKVNPLRVIAAVSMLAVGVCILAFAMSGSEAANRDFISYWAAGQELVHHGNPYDGNAILPLQHASGYKLDRPMVVRNPPSALFLAMPLGFVGARTGGILWSLGLIGALMGSIRMLWILNGRSPDRLHLVGYLFPPALACLLAGQIGIFILFGVSLFFYFHASRPYVAGAALLLCALKPHLFFPFGVVLLAWIVLRRAYRILTGALAALAASSVLSLFLDPAILSHYVHGERAEHIQNLFIPCISLLFRVAIHRNAIWLQFLPAFVACIWALLYFWHHRSSWDWLDQGLLLLLVSVLVAPYAWFTDEALLLPAILAALYRVSDSGRSFLPFGCVAGVALIEVLAGVPMTSGFYVWTAPAWLAWYLYTVRAVDAQPSEALDPPLLAKNGEVML
jgi:hypothetical protein